MSDNTVALTVVSAGGPSSAYGYLAIGKYKFAQHPPSRGIWIAVIDRLTTNVVYNQVQTDPSAAPNIGSFNTPNYILVVAALGMGLDVQPQGALFTFLDQNGAGRELRRIDQIAVQLNCGSLGTYSYALVSVMGNSKGFEMSGISGHNSVLTVQLMPIQVGDQTLWTPVALNDA